MRALIITILVTMIHGCGGSANVFDCVLGQKSLPCSEKTAEEEARAALRSEDFATAIDTLEEFLADHPEEYRLFPLLAAAYAGRAGLKILDVATAQFGAATDIFAQFSQFVPGPEAVGAAQYRLNVQDMKTSVARLELIPAELLGSVSAEDYASTVALQKSLYQTAYSVMLVNQLAVSATTGSLDPNQLANMTEDEALEVISALSDAAILQASGGDPAVQAKIDAALAAIEAEPGESKKEKLASYINSTQGQTPAPAG